MSLVSSLNVGVSALRAYSEGIQVVSNNIANVNTVGYKASHAQYADTFSNVLRPLVPNSRAQDIVSVKIPPTQVGGGVQIESIAPVFSQGTIQITNSNSDLAIAGNGFFQVYDVAGDRTFATRAGNFRVDAEGYLVTQQGFRVQGAIGAATLIEYNAATGSFNVKGSQSNDQVTIPAGITSKTFSAVVNQGNPNITVTASDAAVLIPGQPISGSGIPSGTTVLRVNGTTVTLSQNATASATAANLTARYKTASRTDNKLVLPVDYARADVTTGMEISGDGVKVGTKISSSSGNVKTQIPAALASMTLTGTTTSTSTGDGTTPTVGNWRTGDGKDRSTVAVDSTAGLIKGMVLSLSSGLPIGATARIVDILDSTRFVIDQQVTVGVTGLASVAAGDKTLDQGSNYVRLNSLALAGGYQISQGTKASIEGFSSTAYVVKTDQNIFGTFDVVLGDQPAASLVAAPTFSIETTQNSATVTGVDVSKLRVGDVISGTGIPSGAIITGIGANQITLSSAATATGAPTDLVCLGKPIYPTSSSYGAVQMAFGDQTILLNKNPLADSYDAFKVSLGTAYTSATKIGDVRIMVKNQVGEDGTDVPDGNFKFTDTEGNLLKAGTVDFAAASAGVPKIRAFNVGTAGDINVIMSNGQSFNVGSVLLQSYQDPGALIREGDNLFSGLDTAGPYNGNFRDPNNIDNLRPSMNGLGSINGGALELSNVDLGEEFSTMITTQRAFQAGSRVITTTDQMLEEAVNLKR